LGSRINIIASTKLDQQADFSSYPAAVPQMELNTNIEEARKKKEEGMEADAVYGVSVFTCTNRPQLMDQVFNNHLQQAYTPCELVIVLNNNSMDLEEWELRAALYSNIKVFQLDEKVSLGQCNNYAIQNCSYNYVAKFDDDDYYAPYYLKDMMAAFNYSQADIVGKSCRFIYFKSKSILGLYSPCPEFSYVNYVVGATMVFKKEVWQKIKFPDVTEGEDTKFQQDSIDGGFKIFAADRYNYVTIREENPNKHTFQLDDDTYISYCQRLIPIKNFLPLITR
jgi:glycosyltransferase involved in cell wall biosynthesis